MVKVIQYQGQIQGNKFSVCDLCVMQMVRPQLKGFPFVSLLDFIPL